jgi:RNA polymerase sigma factor (sigma-70 family)
VGIEAITQRADWRQDPEGSLLGKELAASLRVSLTPREMECLQLRMDGLCYREIAEVLRIRPGTVGALLARALRRIQKILGREEEQ